MYRKFPPQRGFITLFLWHLMATVFTFLPLPTLRFNSAGSEEAEQKLRQRGIQIHTASSSNSFYLVIWLQLRDCGLMKQRQEKWKIHVLLNTITFLNAAVGRSMLLLMDCAFVCHLKWAETFSCFTSLHRSWISKKKKKKMGWIGRVLFREGRLVLHFLFLSYLKSMKY